MYPISNYVCGPCFFIGVIPLVPLVDWISRGDGQKKAAGFGLSAKLQLGVHHLLLLIRSLQLLMRSEGRETRDSDALKKERRRANFASARFSLQYICRDIIYDIYIRDIIYN